MYNSTNKLQHDDLIRYLEIALDLEKNIFIQEKTLGKIAGIHNSLGIKNKLYKPVKKKAPFNLDIIPIFFIPAMIFLVICYVGNFLLPSLSGFFGIFVNLLGINILFYLLKGAIVSLIIGFLICLITKLYKDSVYSRQYDEALRKYDNNLRKDNARVTEENKRKEILANNYKALQLKKANSVECLKKIYNYNIIEKKYQNIVAISSIYEYLKTGRCKSLTFDEKTGDIGAYNKFEEEKRFDRIITNTEIIISQLNEVIENQYILQDTLRSGIQTINRLVSNTDSISKQLKSSNAKSDIIIYNQQQTKAELEYMNFMNLLSGNYNF